jgi:hypothetical protein
MCKFVSYDFLQAMYYDYLRILHTLILPFTSTMLDFYDTQIRSRSVLRTQLPQSVLYSITDFLYSCTHIKLLLLTILIKGSCLNLGAFL